MALEQAFVLADHTQHALKKFSCGKPQMDQYLSRFAVKNLQLGLSSTWVLPVKSKDPQPTKSPIAAYYTLASSTVSREEIPSDKSLPGYPVPVILLARLAIDEGFQGQGLGEKTLITALRKSVVLTNTGLPSLGVVVDVLDDNALGFYQRYDLFKPFTDDPMRLFVSMHTLKQI